MDIAKDAGATPDSTRFERLREDAFAIIDAGRSNAYRAVNVAMVYSYYELGRRIVEEEQGGSARADYGSKLLGNLAAALTAKYGRGFSQDNLKLMRRFYLVFSADEIGETAFPQFANLPRTREGRVFPLSWSHYLKLMRIEDADERHYQTVLPSKDELRKLMDDSAAELAEKDDAR